MIRLPPRTTRTAPYFPYTTCFLSQADAGRRGPVESVVARQAGLLAGFDEDPRQRVDVAQVRDRERAVASVQVAGAAGIAFGAHETGQHAGPVPAVGALRGPVVVVAGDRKSTRLNSSH